MKFTGIFVGLTFDAKAYEKQLNVFFDEHLQIAARLWLEATTGRVPLWSGMARASLLELSRLVNGNIVLAPLAAKSRIPQGEALGEAELVSQFPLFEFSVTTHVPHYQLQETKNVGVSPSAPWHSFDAGEKAFNDYVKGLSLPPLKFAPKVIRKL